MGFIPALQTMIMAIAWPVVSRVLMALGFGVLVYEGLDIALYRLLDKALAQSNNISGPIGNLLAMSGFFEAMTIIMGGLVGGLSLIALNKITFSPGGPSTPSQS